MYGIFVQGNSKIEISGNTCYGLSGTPTGIYCDCLYAIISKNYLVDNSTGINVVGDYVKVVDNYCKDNTACGIYVGGTSQNCSLTSNYCYNNGSDTGIANTNSNNFSDSGTDTQTYSNSWQTPVASEPAQGELHWLKTAPTTSWWWQGYCSCTIVSVTNSYLPVGAKSVEMFVRLYMNYHFLMTSQYSGCTCTGAWLNMTAYNDCGTNSIGFRVPIPVDSNRKFYYRSWDTGAGGGAADAQIDFSPVGYYS
jgi:parallel beta-helix repeat protein